MRDIEQRKQKMQLISNAIFLILAIAGMMIIVLLDRPTNINQEEHWSLGGPINVTHQ